MPQLFLPGFPEGATGLGRYVKVLRKDDKVSYWVGGDEYFSHKKKDSRACHLGLTLLIRNRHVRVCEVEKDLAIPHRTLMNWLKKYDDEGSASFFTSCPPRKGPARVLTEETCIQAGRLLDDGESVAQVARELGVKESTLRKGVRSGRVKGLAKEESPQPGVSAETSDKSERSIQDAQASDGMGMACTRPAERLAAALGKIDEAGTVFEPCKDVDKGGLLVGLPALCDNGLLSGLGGHLALPNGFYSAMHIVLLLGYMALARLRRPEALRHIPAGEIGKIIGLDRVPEVKTLREKIKRMAADGDPQGWMLELSRSWMEADPDEAGYVYVDGHVRTYHGTLANLPRRYVSRDRLCLRGTTDYWVNDALGRPFFVVSQAVTEGMGSAILSEIVPELLQSIPRQPTEAELEADPLKYRFVMIFDRECSNYIHLSTLWEQRIAAITYRKNVKDQWAESEFHLEEVTMPGGEIVHMKLAFRDTAVSSGEKSLPVLEVRRLTDTGHQTAIITTARTLSSPVLAARMFTRWCQENYFSYMMQHYDIDGLVEYGSEELSGTVRVVNPAWRILDKQVKDTTRLLRKKQVKLARDIRPGSDADLDEKASLLQEIQTLEEELNALREKRRRTPGKVEISTLPSEERPTQLAPLSKQLTNTIKMVSYRAETALVALLKKHLNKEEEARALLREIFVTDADLDPDNIAGTLTVHLHHMTTPAHDKAVATLLEDLNKREFRHPQTNARMIYRLA